MDYFSKISFRAVWSTTCFREYSLGVPFTERFFDMTLTAKNGQPSGYMGMITANSFMKREFGKKLVEVYLPNKDLTHIIDTSGAYIPGHGTPTVILFARNRTPVSECIRAALGIRGEPKTPEVPENGKLWTSIIQNIELAGTENSYISIVDQPRKLYKAHPWSLGGGGAPALKELIEGNSNVNLGDVSVAIGFVCITKQDDIFVQDSRVFNRAGITKDQKKNFGIGEQVRDWNHQSSLEVLFPYNEDLSVRSESEFCSATKFMWPYKTDLYSRKVFGGNTYRKAGKRWYEYGQIPVERYKIKNSIVFAFVATHNHFAFDTTQKVFKQSAPVIKLPKGSTNDQHYSLLGILNSSIACFWMKQVFHNKGDSTDSQGARVTGDPAFDTYEYTSTGLKSFPLSKQSDDKLTEISTTLDNLASSRPKTGLKPQ